MYEDRVGLDADSCVTARQVIAPGPMGCGATIVEQAGGGEQVRAGAHGHRSAGTAGRAGDPVDDACILDCKTCAWSPGYHKRVMPRWRLRQRIDTQPDSVLHRDDLTVGRTNHLDAVRVGDFDGCVAKDLNRSEHVERLAALDRQHEDVARA
jgi:hypothetical protein